MLNKIIIQGRCCADVELRRTNSGTAVASVNIACDRDFAPKDGGEKETDFVSVVAWKGTAEFLSKYFQKGRMIIVSGRLQMRNYTDKNGNKRTAAEVVADNVYFGDSKPQATSDAHVGFAPASSVPADSPANFELLGDDDSSVELPF